MCDTLASMVCRATSSIGLLRSQGLSNNVVVKFITEYDELFRRDGEPTCSTTNFLQRVTVALLLMTAPIHSSRSDIAVTVY